MASTACIPPVPAPQDAVGLRDRARGALLGLAVGDALGAPAENMKPSEIRARWGRITGYVADRPAGTDDTEYAIFSGLLLARHGAGLTQAHVETAWHEWIADREEGPFRGAGFSERGTLENLRRGLAAPISAQHRHAWSDGLAMRAAPHGVFAAGRPAEAARLAAIDGSVSHEGEGIYGGQAVAAGVAAAMAGASTVAVVASALAVVPDDSWTARCLRRALTAAHRGERAVRSAVVIGGYPWTDLAPEAVALAFGAYAAADGDFTDSVLTAVNMGRDADTTAAVAGALAGATRGVRAIPSDWADAIGPARGSCLPSMAGHHVLEVADLLTRAAHEAPPDPGHARDPEAGPPTSHTHTTGQATRPPDRQAHPHPTPDKASDTAPGVHTTTQTTPHPDSPPHPTPDKTPDTAPTPLRPAPATTHPAPDTPTTTQTTPHPDPPPHPTPDKTPDTAPTPLRPAPATTHPTPDTPTTTQTTPHPDSPPRPDPVPTPLGAPAPSASGAVPLGPDPHATARAAPAPDPRPEPGETPHTAPAAPPPAPGTGHPAPGTRAAAAVGP